MESTNEIYFPLRIKEEPEETLPDVENNFVPKDMASYNHAINFQNDVIRCDRVVNWFGEFSKKGESSTEKVENKFESQEEKSSLNFLNTPTLDLETYDFLNNKSEDITIHRKIGKEVSSAIENEFDEEIQIIFENQKENPNSNFLNSAVLDLKTPNSFLNNKTKDIIIYDDVSGSVGEKIVDNVASQICTNFNLQNKEIKQKIVKEVDMIKKSEAAKIRPSKPMHSQSNRYNCNICDKSFNRYYLKKHIDIVHKNLKTHECYICHNKFGYKQQVQKHIKQVHKKLKTYERDIRRKRFSNKN